MRHRQIEAFRCVMVAGSITEASKTLHISQPSVSRLIADLEHVAGLVLFERKHGRIYPTVEAVQLFEEVERSFRGLDRLARFARTLSDLRQANVTISGMPALSMDLIPNIVAKLMRRYRRPRSPSRPAVRNALSTGWRCNDVTSVSRRRLSKFQALSAV